MKKATTLPARLLSVLLIIVIMMSLVSVVGVAGINTPDSNAQIEYTGGWNPPEYPTKGTLYKDRIAVSKTIAPTQHENYFDITLKVVAKPRVIDQSVDVVVVMDISNTMNSTHKGLGVNDAGYKVSDARLTHAKNAVDTFLDLYAVDKNISEDRRFGLVTFNSYANTVVPLTTVNTTAAADSIKKTVDSITAPTGNRERFTNIEGGLQLAHNLLKQSDAAFRYIIFITDGFPTTYIESGRNSLSRIVGYDTYVSGAYSASKAGTDGYFADSVTRKVCSYGVNYSDKAADRADDVADSIKSDGINIFSIGIDVGVQSIPDYLNNAKNTTHTTVDRTSSNHVIGNTTESYKSWLRDSIAGGPLIEEASDTEEIHRYAQGNSSAQLNTAFANILKDIELIPAETMEEAYTIDPMSDCVEFMNFYDLAGNPADKVTNTKNGKNVATFNPENESVKWWLTNTQNFYIDNIGNYVLSLSYRVRLKNEADGFSYATPLKTNDKTTFYFKTVDFATGEPLYGDNSIDYFVPEVEGYFGNLTFTKQDSLTGHPLDGAEFTLQHYAASCHICHGDAVIADKTATSGSDGIVSFTNLPSGHEYVLMETKAPEGYQRGAHHAITVAYGKTYIDGEEITELNPAVVRNTTIEPVEIHLSAKKNLVGRDLTSGEFSFILEGVFEHGNKFHESATNDENGIVNFHEIIFDEVGKYSFTIREEKGTDTSVIYDDTIHHIDIIITLSEDGKHYEAQTIINGETATAPFAPESVQFTNTLRENGKAILKAEKTLDGKAPEDGVFQFLLKNKRGNVLQQKSTENGIVTFDELTFDSEGIYRFSISELHTDNGLMPEIFFDHSVYYATVTVTAPQGNGPYIADVSYTIDGEPVESILFENKTRTEASLRLNALKTLDGLAPQNEQFAFELRSEDGAYSETVRNDSLGAISFSELTFDKIGHYHYTISEISTGDEGIIYDRTVYTVGVTVEARHNNPSYYLDVIIKKPSGTDFVPVAQVGGTQLDISAAGSIIFSNALVKPAQVTLGGTKTLDGTEPSRTQVFTFELADEQGNIVQTTSNNLGSFTFEAMEFSRSGEYRYTIREVVGNDENILYDTTVYNVLIKVTAPSDGSDRYIADVTLSKGEESVDKITFSNKTVEATTTSVPVDTDPSEPSVTTPLTTTTDPSEPSVTTPSTTITTDPSEPLVTTPSTTTATDPSEPSVTNPSTTTTDPSEPSVTTPSTTTTDPSEPFVTTPSTPAQTHTTKPSGTVPAPDKTDSTGAKSPSAGKPSVPGTGDYSSLTYWLAVLFVCTVSGVTIGAYKKKKHD